MNIVYTLILTLSMGAEGGVSIQTIRFPNEKACMIAGDLWIKKTFLHAGVRHNQMNNAICVPSL